MAKGGIITRKDMFSDDALNFGPDYAKNLQVAIEANNKLVEVAKQFSALAAANGKIANHQQYIAQRNEQRLADEKALALLKQSQQAEIGMERIKRERLATDTKIQASSKKTVDSTERERVAELKLQKQREKNIDTFNKQNSAYALLVKRRNEAQTALANLLAAENKEPAAIRAATREFEKLDVRLKSVNAATKNYTLNIGNYQSAFSGLGATMRSVFAAFGLVGGVTLFATIMRDVFNVIKDVDRQLIAVGKTTNITGEELKQFGRDVVNLGADLDGVSIQGLLSASEVAGQLGVRGTENILKFSTAIEKLKLTSNIISEEQVQNFAKFIEVSSDSFENADRLASVITQLGNNFAATEAEVLANATEIQKGTAVYNSTAQSILGIGAATAALGSEAEASRSALQSTFGVINAAVANGTNLEKVLKLTGLTQKELSEQFNSDAGGVFVKFVGGLNKIKNEGGNLKNVLDDLDLREKRAFTVVGSLAINYDLLTRAVSEANAEYQNNAALNREVEAASQSISSILGDINDKWQEYILNTNDANDGTGKITTTLKFLRDNLSGIINGFIKYGSVLLTYLGVQKAVNFATTIYNALQAASAAAQLRFALATGIGTKSVLAQAAAVRAATTAQEGMNVAMTATPWGAILALLAAAVVAYQVFNEKLSESEKLINEISEANKNLAEREARYAQQREQYRTQEFEDIENEIRLRKAQGENSKKLDEEEIARKRKNVQASLDLVVSLAESEKNRTKAAIAESDKRIAIAQKEYDEINRFALRNPFGDSVKDEENKLNDLKRANKVLRATISERDKITQEEAKRLNKILSDLDKTQAIKDAEFKSEESKKDRAARLKALKEKYNDDRKSAEDDFKLRQFRLQNTIELDQEIVDAEKSSLQERIDALTDMQQVMDAKTRENAVYQLQQLGKYNEETGKLVRELSDVQINELIRTGNAGKQLTAAQKLIYEQYQAGLTESAKKGALNRQKIIDAEADVIQKNIERQLLNEDTKLQQALDFENQLYQQQIADAKGNQKLLERAQIEHEDRIYEIKRQFQLKGLKLQIDTLESELANNDAKEESDRLTSDKRAEIANKLAIAQREYSDAEKDNSIKNADEKLAADKKYNDIVKELAQNVADTLIDFTNAVFDSRISNIDNELSRLDDYYSRQIELAGDDQSKKELLDAEYEKKRQKLEEKKRKEQLKQAIFNRVITLSTIASQTAMASIAALAPPPVGLGPVIGGTLLPYIVGFGALQAAAVLAAPLPKYKDGRKGGKEEFAVVGDGGRSEVVESISGKAYVTPAKSTIVKLLEGDTVHRSVDAFKQSQRKRIMSGMASENQKLQSFQVLQYEGNMHGAEMLEELRLTRKAINKMKPTVIVHQQKPQDFNHELWKAKQLSR